MRQKMWCPRHRNPEKSFRCFGVRMQYFVFLCDVMNVSLRSKVTERSFNWLAASCEFYRNILVTNWYTHMAQGPALHNIMYYTHEKGFRAIYGVMQGQGHKGHFWSWRAIFRAVLGHYGDTMGPWKGPRERTRNSKRLKYNFIFLRMWIIMMHMWTKMTR